MTQILQRQLPLFNSTPTATQPIDSISTILNYNPESLSTTSVNESSFQISPGLHKELEWSNLQPNKAYALSVHHAGVMDDIFQEKGQYHFERTARKAYTFYPERYDQSIHNIPFLIALDTLKLPLGSRELRGSRFNRLFTNHPTATPVQPTTESLHRYIRSTQGLLDISQDTSISSKEVMQVVMSTSDFKENLTQMGLKTNDTDLLNFIFGNMTSYLGGSILPSFPHTDRIWPKMSVLRIAPLTSLISATHFVTRNMVHTHGNAATPLQPYFVSPYHDTLDAKTIKELRDQGFYPVMIGDSQVSRIFSEESYKRRDKEFKIMFRSLIQFARTNLMPDFVRDLYNQAYDRVATFPDWIQEKDEIKNLLLQLASMQNDSRLMKRQRMTMPSDLIGTAIREIHKKGETLRDPVLAKKLELSLLQADQQAWEEENLEADLLAIQEDLATEEAKHKSKFTQQRIATIASHHRQGVLGF